MDEAKLREIEERANAATPGMWLAVSGSITDWNGGHSPTMEWIPRGERSIDEVFGDANFIVHARDDVPALVAEVRRLTAALATVTTERDALADGAECVRRALLDVARHITADPCDSDEALATPTARLVAVIDESADELRATIDRACEERDEARAALATARREGAEAMREAVKAEILAAFHYNDPPDDGVERPIAPRAGEWEAHQTLRRLLLRVCVVLTDGDAT